MARGSLPSAGRDGCHIWGGEGSQQLFYPFSIVKPEVSTLKIKISIVQKVGHNENFKSPKKIN
jgi:hypothetical protein